MKQFLVIAQFFIISVQIIHCDKVKSSCVVQEKPSFMNGDVSENTKVCVLEGRSLKKLCKDDLLTSNYTANEIRGVLIKNTSVKVLTDDVCEALPMITIFEASSGRLCSVEETSLKKCSQLVNITLGLNRLTTLPSKIFHWNTDLKNVNLHENKLTFIHENLFEKNPNLISVDLSGNRLRFIPQNVFKNTPNLVSIKVFGNQLSDPLFLEEMPEMQQLTEINIHRNKFSDLNVEKIHKNFPNLNIFWLYENEFLCERQKEIFDALKAKDINYGKPNGNCIDNEEFWETRKILREFQREMTKKQYDEEAHLENVDIDGTFLKGETLRLTFELVCIEENQRIIFIILGATLVISFTWIVFGWSKMEKIFARIDSIREKKTLKNVQSNNTGTGSGIDKNNMNINEHGEYNIYHTYDHLEFK